MAFHYETRECEFCRFVSEVSTAEQLDADGWTEVADVEGALERCPKCTKDTAPTTRVIRLSLAEKPTDLLVHLVDHGPATGRKIAEAFDNPAGGVYAGGLNVLHALGFIAGPRNEHDQAWTVTDDGCRVVAEARARADADASPRTDREAKSRSVDSAEIVAWLRGRTGAHGGGFTSPKDVADAIEREFVAPASPRTEQTNEEYRP